MKYSWLQILLLFTLFSSMAYAQAPVSQEPRLEPTTSENFTTTHRPRYFMPFIGIDLGAGITGEPRAAFNAAFHAGLTFFYRDIQGSLLGTIMGIFLHTSIYAGFDFGLSNQRFNWAPKIGILQTIGPFVIGLESLYYTSNNFRTTDIRLNPYVGLTMLNIITLSVGPNIHIAGTELASVSRWRAYFTIRIPIDLIYYLTGL